MKCPGLRNTSWHDILVTHSINVSVQQLVHGPYSDITMISLTRSPHACFMLFLNSLSLTCISTFLATSIQMQHPSLPSSEYIEPIGRERISPWASSIVNFIFSSRNQFVFVAADEISCNTSAGNKHCYFLVHPSTSQYPFFFPPFPSHAAVGHFRKFS